MGRNASCGGRLYPHLGHEDFLRDLPAAIDLQQRQLIGEEARWNGAFELHIGHCRTDEVDCQYLIVAGQASLLRRRSRPDLVQPAVTGRDNQLALVRNAGQRARWMKCAGDLAGVALVKSVEVGLDHAFDDFDIVSAGHGGQVLPYESFGDQGFEIRKAAASGNVRAWKDSTDIAAPAAKANELN